MEDSDDDDDDEQEGDLEITEFLADQSVVLFLSSLPTLFPYVLADVCREWQDILSSSPTFWTRLVLMIGAPSTAIDRAHKYLAWSRQLPIDVFILRSHGPRECNSQVERELVHSFLQLLQPHMKRCRSLHLDIKTNSSLPSLSQVVPNHAPLIRSLYIHCGIDDADVGNTDKTTEEEEQKEEVAHDVVPSLAERPRFHMIKIDGRSFHRTIHNPLSWFISQPQLQHLEISTFNASTSKLPLLKSLTTICNFHLSLSSLCFSGLNFDVDTRYVPTGEYMLERVRSLVIDGVRPVQAVEELFRVCALPNLDILNLQDCPGLRPKIFDLLDSLVPILSIQNFEKSKKQPVDPLTGKSNAKPHADIIHLLTSWSGLGLSLSVSDTPFDDVLDALSSPAPLPPRSSFIHTPSTEVLCPNLQSILISACPSPSFSSMKELIKQRNKAVNYRNPRWREREYDGPVIMKIVLKYCWPEWTRAEKEWVRERVVDFEWFNNGG